MLNFCVNLNRGLINCQCPNIQFKKGGYCCISLQPVITVMPNIKSAIKRVDVNEKKKAENKSIKSRLATYTKKFKAAVAENNLEVAENLYKEVVSYLDSAAKENVIHKNCASRKKAHFAKMLDDAKNNK